MFKHDAKINKVSVIWTNFWIYFRNRVWKKTL